MRKFFIIICLMVMINVSIFSGTQPVVKDGPGTNFMIPRGGSSGIPMAPSRGESNDHYTEVQNIPNRWAGKSSRSLSEGYYTNQELILSAGVKDIRSNVENRGDIKVNISVDAPQGMFFFSASNPSYKRPFELCVVPRGDKNHIVGSENSDKFGIVDVIDSVTRKADFTMREVLKKNDYPDPILWFDLVLVLPGTMNYESDTLIMDDGSQYPLIRIDDYNAVVTVHMSTSYKDASGAEVVSSISSITIPFSGEYDPTKKLRDTTKKISMYVHPSARAGNINMRDYNPQEVAEIRLQATKDDKMILSAIFGTNIEDSYYMFLSSSSEPSVPGETFKLVLDGMKFGTELTPYNSVGYEVILSNNVYDTTKSGSSPTTVFKGTESNKDSIPTNAVYPDKSFYDEDARIYLGGLYKEGTKIWDYDGTVYIQITNNSGYVMKAGRYTSQIYVHVIEV